MKDEPMDMIHRLESYPSTEEIDVERLLQEYKLAYRERPLWQMIEDIQRQAMLYHNIIEQLKSGREATEIRDTFEELGLMPMDVLPNPNVPALLTRAFNKVAQYRRALVEIVKRFGGQLLDELSIELGLTIGLGVNVGFPPSITITVEHTTVTQTITTYSSRPG